MGKETIIYSNLIGEYLFQNNRNYQFAKIFKDKEATKIFCKYLTEL